MVNPPILLGAAAIVLGAWLIFWNRKRQSYPLPPSPMYWPIIGNLLSMPTENEHIGFMKLGKMLGSDIISLRMFGTQIIVLNSSEDAINLLEKRSGIYSDRICPTMLREPSLMHWPGFITLLGYNDRWRKSRRLMHTWLHKKAAESFHSSQQLQSRLLLQRLLQRSKKTITSNELDAEFHRTAAATLVDSIYGYKLQSDDDPFVLELKEAMDHGLHAALPSSFLVNLFPALVHVPEWFPGARWKKTAREWRIQKDRAVDTTYDWAKEQISSGAGEPSIIASLLEHAEQLGLQPDEIDDYVKNVAVSLLSAGTDTTTNTLLVFVLAMLLFPDTQRKAQAEIDSVVGLDRLPTFDDRPKLSYVERLLQEVFRWCPILPGGFPHACYEDDVYRGYRIPKGALVIANVWSICRNPEIYTKPEDFNPDRFLDHKVPLPPAFGYGRRSCPGIHYADSSLFIAIASILATFQIRVAKDELGNEVFPNLSEGSGHVVYRPEPFKLVLTPRSPGDVDQIRCAA